MNITSNDFCDETTNVTATFSTETIESSSEYMPTKYTSNGDQRQLRTTNISFEESLLITKCCTIKYNEYLYSKNRNNTILDDVLDVVLGTVKYIFEKKILFLKKE